MLVCCLERTVQFSSIHIYNPYPMANRHQMIGQGGLQIFGNRLKLINTLGRIAGPHVQGSD